MEEIFNSALGKKIITLTKASFRVANLIPDLILREKIKHQILKVYKNFFEKKHLEMMKDLNVLDGLFCLGNYLNLVKDEHLKVLRNGFIVFKSHTIFENRSPEPPSVLPVIKNNNDWGVLLKRLGVEIKEWMRECEKIKHYPLEEHLDCLAVLADAEKIFKKIEEFLANKLDVITPVTRPNFNVPKKENSAVKVALNSRQEKILNNFSNKETMMQLADFLKLFPEFSERTIRNDLTRLIKTGKIRRKGMGSGSYYWLS